MKKLITDLLRQEFIDKMGAGSDDVAALECLGCMHDHLKETGEQITLDEAPEWADKNFDCMAKAEALSRFNVKSMAELNEHVHAWWLTGDSVLIRAPRDIEIKMPFAVSLKRTDSGRWCATAADYSKVWVHDDDPDSAVDKLRELIQRVLNAGMEAGEAVY